MLCSVCSSVVRWMMIRKAIICVASVCIVAFLLLSAETSERRAVSLTSEDAVAAFYVITRTAASAIITARAYPTALSSSREVLVAKIWNDVVSIQAVLTAIEQSQWYASFPPEGLKSALASAFERLRNDDPDIAAVEKDLQNVVLFLSTWLESDRADIESVVGFTLGLAVPALIRQVDPTSTSPGGGRLTLSQFADQFERTIPVLETFGFDEIIVPTLRSLCQHLRSESVTHAILNTIREEAESLEAYFSASSNFMLSRQIGFHTATKRAPSSLSQARVLVLPFEVTGDPRGYEWLAVGLANDVGIQIRLNAPFERVFFPVEYAPMLPQLGVDSGFNADTLADALGATHLLTARCSYEQENILINWAFSPISEGEEIATGELRRSFSRTRECAACLIAELGKKLGLSIGKTSVVPALQVFEANGRGVAAWVELFTQPGGVEPLYRAISHFEQALDLDPTYAQAAYHLGLVSFYIDDDRTLRRFQSALSCVNLTNLGLIAAVTSVVEGDRQARLGLQIQVGPARELRLEAALQNYRAAIFCGPSNAYFHARLASVLSHLARHEEALKSAETAVALFKHDGALHELLGSLLLTLSGDNPLYRTRAVEVMEQAIQVGPLDCAVRKSNFVECLPREFYMAELAVAYADWLEWDLALHWAEKALSNTANLPAGEEDVIQTMVNNRIAQPAREAGRTAASMGDLHEAVALFHYALEAARILDDDERMSVEWGNIALVHRRLGELEQARHSYLMAYELTNRASQQVVLLHNLAMLHAMLGDPVAAEIALTKAEDILPRVSTNDAAELQAMIWSYRAQLAFNSGEISAAFQMLDQAIDTTPDSDSRFNYRVFKVWVLGRIGLIEESLAIMKELAGEIHSVTDQEIVGAFARQMLSIFAYGATPPQDLLTLAIRSTNDVAAKADLYRILAAVLGGQGKHAEAEVVLGTALSIAPPGQQALVQGALGFHYLLTQEYSQALEEFQHALWGISRSFPSEDERWANPKTEEILFPSVGIEALWGKSAALQGLAREGSAAASKQALYEEAWLCFDTALALLDQVRTGAREERYATSIIGKTYDRLFEDAISHIVEMGDLFPGSVISERSFYIAEQAKARSTADSLFNFNRNPFALVLDNPDLVSALQNLNLKIDELTAQLSSEKRKPEDQQSLILVDTLTNELSRARREFQSLWEEVLGTKTSAFISVNIEEITSNVAEALKFLEPHEAVLEYMVTEKGVYLWVISAGEQEDPHKIGEPIFVPYPREQLMNNVIALRQAIEGQNPDAITVNELLTSFYMQLVQPGLAHLNDEVDTLILIPSGPLWYLPFSALRMSDRLEPEGQGIRYPYLVEKFTLAYLPSLAILPLLEREEIPDGASLLALADPKLSPEQEDLPRYENLEEACRAFARCLVGEEEGVYAGEAAQEERAYREAVGRQVVMYACHGEFDPYVPLQSKLLLAPLLESGNEEDNSRLADGDYHAWETFLTDHKGVKLVILAACETLLPAFRQLQGTMAVLSGQEREAIKLTPGQLKQIITGDEVVGLARAFLSSGAEAVLGTLWQANPKAIEKLLVSMCGYHQQEMTWVQALTKAQRELIKDDAFKSPWLWAPYQLIGRWR